MANQADAPVLHCPHCLETVGEHAHFCTACGMPISVYSTIGPMEQVWALGWLVNRLLSQRPSTFTVVGVWGLALPSLLMVVTAPVTMTVNYLDGDSVSALAGLVLLLPSLAYLVLAARVTLNYLRSPPRGRPATGTGTGAGTGPA